MQSKSHRSPRRRDILAASGAVLIAPAIGLAAEAGVAKSALYPASAFYQTSEAGALHIMFGKTPKPSSDVKLTAPDIAENGAVVPIKVDANLSHVTTLAILALHNPFTLAAAYEIPPGTSPLISSRIKLARTTTVVAVYRTADELRSASKQVKVTLGGCG